MRRGWTHRDHAPPAGDSLRQCVIRTAYSVTREENGRQLSVMKVDFCFFDNARSAWARRQVLREVDAVAAGPRVMDMESCCPMHRRNAWSRTGALIPADDLS